MSTSVETLFVPVRYYTAQDIYYYQVDNRPLQDIVTNLTTLAETTDTLSQTVTGVADISLASGVSASIPEASGQNAVIVLTGTLTSPCTAVFPSGGNQSWVVSNQTNEDVYVSYVGSANSTLLESGYIARFYTDGTNMVGNVPAGLDQANTFSQPQVFAGTVDVSGGATFASTLDVSGGATFASTLDVSGGAIFASTLDVSGGATFAEPVTLPAATANNQAVNLGQLQTTTLARNAALTYSASTTLTASNAGQLIFYTGSGAGTFTLPLANAVAGFLCPLIISNQGGGPLTIVVQSGDGLDLNPSVLQPNQYCAVANDGANSWHTYWNTAGSSSPISAAAATASNQVVNLGQALEVLLPSDSETITPTALTTVVQVAGLAANATLTIEDGTVAGQEIIIYGSGSAYTTTVSMPVTAGSPSINYPYGAPGYSYTIPASSPTQGIRLWWDGTNYRAQTFGQTVVAPATANNEAVNLGQFPASLTGGSGGYQKFPNGLIIQWGSYSPAAADTVYNVSFPIAFPNAVWSTYASPNNGGTTVTSAQSYAVSTSQIGIIGSAANIDIAWLAIGS